MSRLVSRLSRSTRLENHKYDTNALKSCCVSMRSTTFGGRCAMLENLRITYTIPWSLCGRNDRLDEDDDDLLREHSRETSGRRPLKLLMPTSLCNRLGMMSHHNDM